ncbi:MAG: BMP family ABC transporter substrate-binding protein [Spirochaetales bacterium]|nr:BMP family ABC transporter substrate-binding protein [Spirochaetales bacterium]
MLLIIVSILFTGCEKKKEKPTAEKPMKAGFVYVGPVGDYGWSHAHDEGRKHVDNKFPWLETIFVESVPEGDCLRIIDRFVQEEKCDVVITTSFGYMDATIRAGEKYTDTLFMHCSGIKQLKNVGTYFIDFYQLYYLNGLMAGALTKSNKIGYVAAFPTPELIRHINGFGIGIKEVNPNANIHVKWIYAWYGPDKAKEAAETLIAEGCDVLAFTEDTPAVIEAGQKHTEKGSPVYTFSHYSPMQNYGKDSVVSGQLADWGVIYEKIFQDIYNGTWTNEDMWWLIAEKAALLGGKYNEIINKKFIDMLKQLKYDSSVSVYNRIISQYSLMQETPVKFDPFTGPVYDNKGNLQIKEGQIATKEDLLRMMYYVDNVEGTIPESD